MADATTAVPTHGPVNPTAAAHVAHRPLDGLGATLTSGLLADWQQRNRQASLPLALRQLEVAGNLDNVRLAIAGAGGTGGTYRGPVFMDSDIYKTLEAVSWESGREPAAELADFAAETTALLAKAQQPDGYLNSYVQVSGTARYMKLESSHEQYCAGHLIQAAVAAARTFDGGALLAVARRLADHLVSSFLGQAGGGDAGGGGKGNSGGLDGHPIIETALVELYRETGASAYLELARQFVDQRGHGAIGDSGFGSRYLIDHVPVRQSLAEVGHAVRALYLESGVVDVAVEAGDAELLAGSIARWDDMVATKTALTGGNGSRHSGEAFGDAYELPPDRSYNETCAAIASLQWSWRLLLATGDSKYADLIERIIYNGFGAAVAVDGQRFFYVNPLQRRAGHFEDDDPGRRREWFSCACCPPNIMRTVASLGHYAATVAGDVLYLHQLTGSRVAGAGLELDVSTGYPWAGQVECSVTTAAPGERGLAVRIPAWSGDATVLVNGEAGLAQQGDHGYVVVRRQWRPGDVVTLAVDVSPRLTYPGRRIDALRGTVAVERGPLVYCFEQADQADGADVEDLAVGSGALTERPGTVPGVGSTVVVEVPAARQAPVVADGLPYGGLDEPGSTPASATAVAIPYFQWDNRDGQAMRVWMPVTGPGNSDDLTRR